jgi:cell division protease FtsH
LGTAIPLDFSQTKSFHRRLPFRQIAKLKSKIQAGVSSSVSSDLPADLGLVRAPQPSYTQLLQQLRAGTVKELLLSPGQRQVKVTYADGKQVTVPVFSNDQLLLRTAQEAQVPLTVRDERQDQATASLVSNGLLLLLLFGGLALLLRRSWALAAARRAWPKAKPQWPCALKM